jgi:hypothetical protein
MDSPTHRREKAQVPGTADEICNTAMEIAEDIRTVPQFRPGYQYMEFRSCIKFGTFEIKRN